jgi:hypothetical protein
MSANNFYFAKEINGKWYGWDEMAEDWGNHSKENPVKLHIMNASAVADSLYKLEGLLDEQGIGYAEYGLTTQPYLPKDGTPIEVVI